MIRGIATVHAVIVAELELDLEVFTGPFDLLLTLVLREEVDLLEVELADVVVAYLDHLEARGELDLEVATEFLVLIAALLELKSRLMLPRDDEDELLDELEPGEAAEELLARMLEARRYRRAAEHLAERLAAEDGHRFRSAPLPAQLRRVEPRRGGRGRLRPEPRSARRSAGCCAMPPPLELRPHRPCRACRSAERLAHLRGAAAARRCSFDEAVAGADRVTVAVTLFALLELYKQGEATWTQESPFGDIAIASAAAPSAGGWRRRARDRAGPHRRGAALPGARARSPRPTSRTRPTCSQTRSAAALGELREAYAPGARGIVLRELAGGWTLASDPETEPAARRLLAKPRTPPLTPAQAETLAIVAYLQPVSRPGDHPDPRRQRGLRGGHAARARPDRGVRPLAVRRRPVPHDAALPQAVRPRRRSTPSPTRRPWDPSPEEEADLRDRLLQAGEARAGG